MVNLWPRKKTIFDKIEMMEKNLLTIAEHRTIITFFLFALRKFALPSPTRAVFCFGFASCLRITRFFPPEMLFPFLTVMLFVYDAVCVQKIYWAYAGWILCLVHFIQNKSLWPIVVGEGVKLVILVSLAEKKRSLTIPVAVMAPVETVAVQRN